MERGDLGLTTGPGTTPRTATDTAPRRSRRWGAVSTVLGTVPFFLVIGVVLLLPVGVLSVEAFLVTDPVTFEKTWSTSAVTSVVSGAYGRAYLGSLQLSLVTAVLGTVLGLGLAAAILSVRRGRLLRRLVLTASGVLANFGGIPLAFAFIATIGQAGAVTALLADAGITVGTSLYSMTGLTLVYLYFLVPLMVLTITPALEGLRPQWREASDVLGASGWQFWRRVGGPVLLPSVLGAAVLLFASAFAAYATARALVGSSIPLVTLQIADALSSNVLVGSEAQGKALALGMVVLVGAVMLVYGWAQRRASRWSA